MLLHPQIQIPDLSRASTSIRRIDTLLVPHRRIPLSSDCSSPDPRLQPITKESHSISEYELIRQMVSELPFYQYGDYLHWRSSGAIDRCYDKSLEIVERWRREVSRFVKTLCEVASKYEGFTKDDKQPQSDAQRVIHDLLGGLSEFWVKPIPTPRSLEVSAQPDKSLKCTIYQEHLQASIEAIAKQFLAHLERMHRRGIVGRAEYAPCGRERQCQFSTFFSKAICTAEVSKITKSDFDAGIEYDEETGTWYDELAYVRHVFRSGRIRIQHVHAAFLLGRVGEQALLDYRKPVPERIARLNKSIPSFLKPHLRVTFGDQREGIFVAKDVESIPFEFFNYSHESEKKETKTRPDPIISLGQFVLAHWCNKEPAKHQLRK